MVVTEFGRSLVQKCGVMASCVNDVLLRPCYLPEKWWHRFSVICGKAGEQKCCNVEGKETSQSSVQDIAGPLCFSGDLICRNRLLPNMEVDDVVVAMTRAGTQHWACLVDTIHGCVCRCTCIVVWRKG